MSQTQHAVPGPSHALSAFAADLRFEQIPAAVLERARLHILDGIGLALASSRESFARATLASVAELSGGNGPASVIGSEITAGLRDAAMANGLLVHGLDFDDTHQEAIVHPTAMALPVVLALAEVRDIDPREALLAYCIGMESAVRIGAAVKGGFHHTGFHATGVIAHFSATLAAGRLMGSDRAAHVNALGIAASTASGVQVFLEEGAWTKRLHPGWAAAAGITAATLARNGFKGPTRALEGRFGLFETHLHSHRKDVDESLLVRGLGQEWMMEVTALKPWPICHFIHGAAEAAALLHADLARAGAAPEAIRSVEILLPRDTLPIIAEPIEHKRCAKNEYEGKFSAPYVVARMLLKGRFGLADLEDAALTDPATRALAQLCSCSADPGSSFPAAFSGIVRIELQDGRRLERHVPVNLGSGARILGREDVALKFRGNAEPVVGAARAAEIEAAVFGFEQTGVRALMQLLKA